MNGCMVLMQRLWALKMAEGDDMAQHLNQFRELANQLRSLSIEGKGMEDSELVTSLTLSLPESYEPLVMALQSRSDTITFDMMAGRLLQESGRRQIGHATHAKDSTSLPQQTAFFAPRGNAGPRPQRGRGGFVHNGRGRGGDMNKSRGSFNSTIAGRNTGLTSLASKAGTKCHYCGKNGHWKKDSYKKRSDKAAEGGMAYGKDFTFLADKPGTVQGNGWIIDSGVSQHLTADRTQFTTYRTITHQQLITIADGSRIEASAVGNIVIATVAGVITLTAVWHVPSIRTGLISVTRMVDAGYRVEFEASICYVSRFGIQRKLGARVGNLYHLIIEKASTGQRDLRITGHEAHLGLITNQSPATTLETWHHRLCHRTLDTSGVNYIASRVLDMKIKDGNNCTNKICAICTLGRQQREAETKSRAKAGEVLSVVHIDICGPMETPSMKGEWYFITFTDETTGRVSISLLRSKDQALVCNRFIPV